MQQAHELLRDYEKSGQGWFWSSDVQGRIVYISDRIAAEFGVSAAELVGQPLATLFVMQRDEDESGERTLPLILGLRKTFNGLTIRAATGAKELWWSISGRPQLSAAGEFCGYLGNGTDITTSRQSEKDASRLAMFDALTGIANRNAMDKRVGSLIPAYKQTGRSCALMMLDLDRFKAVNDTLGHQAGDELLKQVAERLQQALGKGAEVARMGGDEFQVLLPDVDDRGRLGELASNAIAKLSQPFSLGSSRCMIGASVGVAIFPFDGSEPTELVRNADLALYSAKAGGRGQFRFYSCELQLQAQRRQQIEADLRDALANDQIWLAYQPIVETVNNKVVALEASLCWTHPDLGEISPDIFLPLADERNLIGPLGDWAIMQACQDAAHWPGNVRVAVNVAPAQFHNIGFPATVTQALAQSGLNPERLELELNESVFGSGGGDAAVGSMFDALKVLGVRFTLDGFGENYAALGFLRSAKPDLLKIDGAFVRGVAEKDSRSAGIVKAIVALAGELGMQAAAEGIEATDQLESLRALGITRIQGFIYAHALNFDEVNDAMASGDWIIEPSGPSTYRPDRITVFRKVGLIHEDHRYEATMRNLSRSGCMTEGLLEVPINTRFVVDFGEGQLAVAIVRRSSGALQGLEFEQPLVDDGAGGLCTRHRVSHFIMASVGMSGGALSSGFSLPMFAQTIDSSKRGQRGEG